MKRKTTVAKPRITCLVVGCMNLRRKHKATLSRYCNKHLPRKRAFPGRAWVDTKGYYRVVVAGKRTLVHNLIWALHHGSPAKGMVIHHRDHNPRNNDIRNLRLMTTSEHSRLHINLYNKKQQLAKLKEGKRA